MKSDRFRLNLKTKIWIMAMDAVVFSLIVALTFQLRLGGTFQELVLASSFWLITWMLLCSLYIFGTYDLDRDETFLPMFFRGTMSVGATFVKSSGSVVGECRGRVRSTRIQPICPCARAKVRRRGSPSISLVS